MRFLTTALMMVCTLGASAQQNEDFTYPELSKPEVGVFGTFGEPYTSVELKMLAGGFVPEDSTILVEANGSFIHRFTHPSYEYAVGIFYTADSVYSGFGTYREAVEEYGARLSEYAFKVEMFINIFYTDYVRKSNEELGVKVLDVGSGIGIVAGSGYDSSTMSFRFIKVLAYVKE